MLSKMWGVLWPSRFDNSFTFIWRYSSKRHSTFVDYFMKLSHCLVHVTGIRVQLHISLVKILNVISVENYLNRSWSSFKSCAKLLAGYNLSNPCLRKTWLYVINYIWSWNYNTKVLYYHNVIMNLKSSEC